MKKVLIALDYDPTAQKVAETGFSLAKNMRAKVILLHVIADSTYYSSTDHVRIMGFAGHMERGSLQLDGVDGIKKTAQQFLDKAKQHLGGRSIQTLVKEGEYADAILTAAKDVHADIIVIGSHSRIRSEKIVRESVTEKVVSITTIPIFIIPTKKLK
jgi:nucleotide-binding universal stress UspA family protein